MNTPAHLLLATGFFAKPDSIKITAAALIGALLPDLSLYILASFSLFITGNTPQYVFGVQYFSSTWQQIFAIDNSFITWGLVFGVGLWTRKPWLVVCAASAVLHLCLDFPLHNDDARRHFWPLSDWVFQSPLSYWDTRHYGALITIIEQILVLGLLVILWRRFQSWSWRIFYTILAALNILPTIMFSIML